MVTEEQKELIQQESKCLWRCRAFKLAVLFVVALCIVIVVQRVRFRSRQIVCAIQLKCLGTSLLAYMNDFEDKLPIANAWNDLIMEYDVTPSAFHCPGSKSTGKTSDYAININWYGNEAFASGHTIFLFECNPGWNQVGGPEIFNFKNHRGKGGYNTIAIPEGQFVKSEEIKSIKWEP